MRLYAKPLLTMLALSLLLGLCYAPFWLWSWSRGRLPRGARVGTSSLRRTVMLRRQYRMHPVLGDFVSQQFYEGTLENGRPASDFAHGLARYRKGPRGREAVAAWLDVPHGRGPERRGLSTSRPAEAEVLARELKALLFAAPQLSFGVIAFYRAQVKALWQALAQEGLADENEPGAFRVKWDQRRAQVFVESLIAEVNADKAAEFGIQWQGAVGKSGDRNIGLLGTNFSIGGQNIISLAAGAASGTVAPSTGGNFGIARQTNGVYVLGFLARFLQANGDGNILSTPNLLTLDNEEAKIVIGQNVPFVTGQYTNNNSTSGSVNPFQTIERKDVGLTLRVKPQISENGTVKLQIFQEVSSVQASSVNSATGLITNKRSIESNVLVEDGSIIVLGGLLEDSYAQAEDKVPLLGDVPIVGNLFRSENRSRKKTNLMVFLRPVVVRDAAASDALMIDRYESIRALQQQVQPSSGGVLGNVQGAPVLPSLRMERSTAPHNAQ